MRTSSIPTLFVLSVLGATGTTVPMTAFPTSMGITLRPTVTRITAATFTIRTVDGKCQ